MRLIDAELLFRFLNDQRVKESGAFSKGLNKGINIARGAVRNEEICPTVDAVPVVQGEWVRDGEVVVCSECGAEHAWEEYRATYCEDCGAKMDGGNENG